MPDTHSTSTKDLPGSVPPEERRVGVMVATCLFPMSKNPETGEVHRCGRPVYAKHDQGRRPTYCGEVVDGLTHNGKTASKQRERLGIETDKPGAQARNEALEAAHQRIVPPASGFVTSEEEPHTVSSPEPVPTSVSAASVTDISSRVSSREMVGPQRALVPEAAPSAPAVAAETESDRPVSDGVEQFERVVKLFQDATDQFMSALNWANEIAPQAAAALQLAGAAGAANRQIVAMQAAADRQVQEANNAAEEALTDAGKKTRAAEEKVKEHEAARQSMAEERDQAIADLNAARAEAAAAVEAAQKDAEALVAAARLEVEEAQRVAETARQAELEAIEAAEEVEREAAEEIAKANLVAERATAAAAEKDKRIAALEAQLEQQRKYLQDQVSTSTDQIKELNQQLRDERKENRELNQQIRTINQEMRTLLRGSAAAGE